MKRHDFRETGGGLEAVRGLRAHGIACGIKANGAPDLALFVSDTVCRVADFYTRNSFTGVHVALCREKLKRSGGAARALLVNSGNANCATGTRGTRDALRVAAEAARLLKMPAGHVLFASTGIIGAPLPADRIIEGLPRLIGKIKRSDGAAAARAIMTTDTVAKTCCVEADGGSGKYRIAGVAKGAGMIAPDLATQFAFIFTDAAVSHPVLRAAARKCVEKTFNAITVDGDTSPNDTALFFASGASGAGVAAGGVERGVFEAALEHVCRALALKIVRDAEGATKLIEVRVESARSRGDAIRMAKAVAESPLVKTAVFGEDPNWGRILTAAGYSGARFRQDRVGLELNGARVYDRGRAGRAPEKLLAGGDVLIRLLVREGRASARVWTCDLSCDYVRINAEYTT
ncbi:MAG: bifunctional glutamate N-acetyltransferase/amino-acid acetyltransferase ArgJ [bacterium]